MPNLITQMNLLRNAHWTKIHSLQKDAGAIKLWINLWQLLYFCYYIITECTLKKNLKTIFLTDFYVKVLVNLRTDRSIDWYRIDNSPYMLVPALTRYILHVPNNCESWQNTVCSGLNFLHLRLFYISKPLLWLMTQMWKIHQTKVTR